MGVNPHPVNLAQALLLEEQARASEEINAYRPLPEFRDALTALEGRALQRPHAPAALVLMQLYIYHNSSSVSSLSSLSPLSSFSPLAQHLSRLPSRIPLLKTCVKNYVKNYLKNRYEKMREKLEDFFLKKVGANSRTNLCIFLRKIRE